jgi:hypothetical protein
MRETKIIEDHTVESLHLELEKIRKIELQSEEITVKSRNNSYKAHKETKGDHKKNEFMRLERRKAGFYYGKSWGNKLRFIIYYTQITLLG